VGSPPQDPPGSPPGPPRVPPGSPLGPPWVRPPVPLRPGPVASSSSPRRRLLAWGAHGLTSLGLVLAAGMAVLIVEGSEGSLRLALLLMGAATLLDAVDGPLARRVRVREVLPEVDGRRLDDLIDFHTFTSLPLLLVWRTGLLPGSLGGLLLLPLLASAYGFSRTDAKTGDGYFLGFPSYWNVVAFYLWALRPGPGATVLVLVGLSALTLLPWRYLKPGVRNGVEVAALVLGGVWGGVVLGSLSGVLVEDAWVLGSLVYPAWYLGASWRVEYRARRGG
jgi:phosphatidylcholine synthase